MNSRFQITIQVTQRFVLASFAMFAVTACQVPSGPNPDTAPSLPPSQADAVCDPFGSSGNSTPTGPLNGLVANLSYLPNGNVNEYTGVMDFEKKATPVAAPIYLSQLYVPTESFSQGFQTGAGTYLTDNNGNKLVDFFALHIESTIELTPSDSEGQYQFALVSDDGSIMQVDTGNGWTQLINNDGNHETEMGCAQQSVSLSHSSALPIAIDYFQGPPYNIALVLLWRQVSPNSCWHNDDSGRCDAGNANPLNDPECGQSGNDLFFNWENQVPSTPNQNWNQLLARGWSVVPAQNFFLANGASNPCNTSTQCFTDTFNQPQQLATSSVDFLLMTDVNSDYNRSDIAGSLQNFASQMPAGVDFSVGLMAGYGTNGNAGTLMHAPSVSTVLSSKSLAISDMQTELAQSINYLPGDRESDNGELGIYSLAQAMTAENVQAAQASGFIRTNAALNVVFLSDQADQCAVNPGTHPECKGITPAFDLAALQAVKGSQPLSINAIVNPSQSNGCGENYGAGYADIVNLLGHGVVIDMLFSQCGNEVSNFAQAMQSIGQQVAALLKRKGNVPLINDFTLSHVGINPSTIAVTVDGSVAQYSYNPIQDQVDLSTAGTYGSTIQVNYCLAPPIASPSPSPSPSLSVAPSPSPSPSVSVAPSPSPSPSVSVAPSPSPSPSVSVAPSPSPSPSVSVAPSPSPSPSPSPTVTDSPSPSPTPSPSPSPSPTVTDSPSPSPTPSPSPSPSPTVTDSPSPSPTPSPSPSPSPTVIDSPSPSPTPSPSSSCTGPFCGGGVLGN